MADVPIYFVMMRNTRLRLAYVWRDIGSLLLLLLAGCPSLTTLPSQAPVQEATERRSNRPYLFYVPSTYTAKTASPLLILCHGTIPYDTADLQMREWAMFAQSQGIIIAAPRLAGTRGDFPPEPEKQIALQQQDEQLMLGIVADLRGRFNIAEEQVFLTGWSAGAYAILYTGLRNPDVFRALAIRQGSFDARYMTIPPERMDRWQPIKVIYGSTDIIRDQTRASIKWLRDSKLFVEDQELPGAHRRIDPKLVWKFFREVMRERPWIRIKARPADESNPLAVKFELAAVPPVMNQKWFFGDKDDSHDASPVHVYEQAGRYEVAVNVALKGGKKYTRKRVIYVGMPEP